MSMMKVLIVDGSKERRRDTVEALAQLTNVVIQGAVANVRTALHALADAPPDLVITDIQLPYVSGLELMEQIRGDEELATVPIMAVTAYSGVGDDERIRAAGAQAYVSKPISVMRFAETVDQLLEDGPVGANEKGGPDSGAAPEESNPD